MRNQWTRRQFLGEGVLAGCALASTARFSGQPRAGDDVLLQTRCGTLRGERLADVRVFRGVPFAQPPIGDLRFRAPLPIQPWEGVREATRFAAAAVQSGDRDVRQSEDCLYLNVWTPGAATTQSKLPVFVWIHGGGFTGGEAFAEIFNGTGFARQGMLVVTVAYRLGVLGFLDMEPLLGPAFAGSANNAVRDLMVALQWVKHNIEAFGGDPDRVTIGGESAGAKLSDLLMGVPAAEGLFRGVVSESGGAERIWLKETAQRVAEGFGRQWTSDAPGRTLTDLRTAPARALIDAQALFLKTWPQHFPLRCELDGTLFPTLPIRTIATGVVKQKRLLIGTNRDESALFLGSHPKRDPTSADLGNMSLDAFEKVYAQYGSVYPEMSVEQRRIRAVTAEEYWVPSLRVADAASQSGATVWMYELAFGRSGGEHRGLAFHSEDLALVWNKPNREFDSAAAEAVLAGKMNAAWAAFIRGETPAATGLPVWPEYKPKSRPTMIFDTSCRIEHLPQDKELQLWREL